MQIQTFRARTMQEALQQIRDTLGPEAAVLQTREVRRGPLEWLTGARHIEVVASRDVPVPSRFAAREADELGEDQTPATAGLSPPPSRAVGPEPCADAERPAPEIDYRRRFRERLAQAFDSGPSLIEDLARRESRGGTPVLPNGLLQVVTDLIEAGVSEQLAQELAERIRPGASPRDLEDPQVLKARAARLLESELRVCGPLQRQTAQTRVVALVGPTGVGKTTTLAKLAASLRLREKWRVGLITVDTYRIAAVEQLRTYAEIIDLPLEVASTPREARAAVERLAGLDLILVDTAGRSPRDEVRLQELKSTLTEAAVDEVHLVLSCVASPASLNQIVARFAPVGATALLLTKLDEATGLGHLWPVLRSSHLPLSYLTTGQNVPDDLEVADQRKLSRLLLRAESG